MAHIPTLRPTVTHLFPEVHLASTGQPDELRLEQYSSLTGQDEVHHLSGVAARTLTDARDQSDQEENTIRSDPHNQRSYMTNIPQSTQYLYKFRDTVRDIGNFKRSLIHKKSVEAFSLLEDPNKEVKDFGRTHEHTSLEGRLLGDSGFQPLAQFMGGENEAAEFATRILKRRYEQDINANLQIGRWPNPEQYDAKKMAQQQAEDVVSAYLGDHEEAGTLVG